MAGAAIAGIGCVTIAAAVCAIGVVTTAALWGAGGGAAGAALAGGNDAEVANGAYAGLASGAMGAQASSPAAFKRPSGKNLEIWVHSSLLGRVHPASWREMKKEISFIAIFPFAAVALYLLITYPFGILEPGGALGAFIAFGAAAVFWVIGTFKRHSKIKNKEK